MSDRVSHRTSGVAPRWWAVARAFALSVASSLAFSVVPDASHAQSAEEIVRRADRLRAPGGSYVWDVTITTYEGSRPAVSAGFEVYVKGSTKAFVKFVSPANRVGRSLLFVDRDLWIYLPDAGKPVRIPLAQRLVGQVANGDVARTNYTDDYTVTLVGSDTASGAPCHVLSLHANARGVTYSAIRYWVAKETFRPVKAEFYSGTGTLLKTGYFERFQELGGEVRATRLTLVDAVRKDLRSTIEFSNLRIREIPDKYFNKNFMADQ